MASFDFVLPSRWKNHLMNPDIADAESKTIALWREINGVDTIDCVACGPIGDACEHDADDLTGGQCHCSEFTFLDDSE